MEMDIAMLNFFHRLFNPHCEHCTEEDELKRHCNSCEILQRELELLRSERDQLLDRILNPFKNEVTTTSTAIEPQPIKPKFIPWGVRRQMLEAESRQAAKLMKEKTDEIKVAAKSDKPLTVEEIEQVLGVSNEGESNESSNSNG